MEKLKITLIQTYLYWEDILKNLSHFDKLFQSVIPGTTDIIVLPEMFTTGFTMNAIHLAEKMDGKTIRFLKKWAKKLNSDITGSLIISENKNFYNRLVWIKPDQTLKFYDKRHLFRMANEDKTYTSGNNKMYVNTQGWKINPLLCYDLRFPVWCRNNSEFDIQIFIANWPEKRSEHWKILLRSRAIENQCYVIGLNRIGEDGKKIYYSGNSSIFDPKGDLMFYSENTECIYTITLSKDKLSQYREGFPAYKDADKFNIND